MSMLPLVKERLLARPLCSLQNVVPTLPRTPESGWDSYVPICQ